MSNLVKVAIENLRGRKQALDFSIFSNVTGVQENIKMDMVLLEDAEDALENLEISLINEIDNQKRETWKESSNQSDFPKQRL